MIIQCRKCETRFRFDDQLMEGDGVWVRCSRCQYVFFEDNPAVEKPIAPPEPVREVPSLRVSEARRIPEDHFDVNAELTPARITSADASADGMASEPPPELPPVSDPEPVIEREDRVVAGAAEGFSDKADDWDGHREEDDEEGDEEEDEEEDELSDDVAPGRRWGSRILKVLLLAILVALFAALAGLWLFPEVRNEVLKWASPGLRSLPGGERIFVPPPASRETVLSPVRLKDIRQRTVANLLAGNLQVIEGVAVNQAPYPLARIQVRLAISDAYDVLLGERIVYAGNLLTDSELGALAEPEILRELSLPQGSDVSNERIAPNGEIPFMIVFSQEQAGAIKTAVAPVGADRAP
jgi:predicted Zn finger-like uncharacterized protein